MLEVPSSPDLYPLNVLREAHTLHFGVRSIANQWKECLQAKPHTRIHPRLHFLRVAGPAHVDCGEKQGAAIHAVDMSQSQP